MRLLPNTAATSPGNSVCAHDRVRFARLRGCRETSVILKLIELHGLVYSEEEADEFRQGQPAQTKAAEEPDAASDDDRDAEAELKQSIDEAKSINAVTDFMLDERTQSTLNKLPHAIREEVRDYAKARLRALGWPPAKKGQQSGAVSPATARMNGNGHAAGQRGEARA